MSDAVPPPSAPSSAPAPNVTRLNPDDVRAEVVDHLRTGAVVALADVVAIDLTGPGAVTCMQGLLTNDVEQPGDGAFVYGALLTPKGMIVVDGWAARLGARVRFTVPTEGRERTLGTFHHAVPPRLARALDRSADCAVLRVAGAHALAVAGAAGLPIPPSPGRVAQADELEIARASDQAPFALQVTSEAGHQTGVVDRLAQAGALVADAPALELARVLAGWPRLASEVDEKTIPQEVRYDEIAGVSYTKGCYPGQETVSRLHFRGHANRQLRGLLFEMDPSGPPAEGWSAVSHDERDVGRVTSVAWLPNGGGSVLGRWIGLAVVRREVPPGAVVRAAGREARVVALPFDVPSIGPA
ncbi:MAG TPA: glycine cleavage T C-terminal barrel domain-containing protein [Gemmatimonadales bacterium]|jgi:folate-binding protein YgfZ|nr:glycine cleavage T C-terminal barrel domain-containing protein [Gemmatimonadales bacterium]